MPIEGRAYVQYLTSAVAAMRSEDYAGQNVVNLLKGRPFTGNYSQVADQNNQVLIDRNSADVVRRVFVDWSNKKILSFGFKSSICLVPIPNKIALITNLNEDFPSAGLARAVQASFSSGVYTLPLLRWRIQLQKASENGPRDPSLLYPHLEFIPPSQPLSSLTAIVLIDDVTTSGGHAQACAARLKKHGYKVALLISAAKTYHEQLPNAFEVPSFNLDEYFPGGL